MKILFQSPLRSNIYLQVTLILMALILGLCLYWHQRSQQVREHDLQQDSDQESLIAFIPPMLADSSRISMQIFFQTKFLLNKASEYSSSETNTT